MNLLVNDGAVLAVGDLDGQRSAAGIKSARAETSGPASSISLYPV